MSRENITTDEFALLAFKSSITLDPYHMVNNWSTSSSSLCNWVGVTCDTQHGRVNGLNLSNMGLEGTISPQLGNLSFLVELDLHGNSLYGHLPQQLFGLHQLKLLDLSYNEFFGGIPEGIGELSELQYLNLSYNQFSGFIPQSISNLSMLEQLDFTSNAINGTIPTMIGHLRRLKILYMKNNTLWGNIPSTISNLSSLQKIGLSFNSLSGKIPKGIGDLSQLRYLHLQNNKLWDNISSTLLNFNNSILQHFAVGYNKMFGNLPSNICQWLPNLTLLYLFENDISGDIPTVWHQCKDLEYLALSHNSFNKGPIPGDIAKLTKLQELYLAGNNLEGSIPRSIGNCTSLKVLSLGDNFLTGSIPMEIGNLDQLEILSLANNSLSGSISSKLFNFSAMTELYLEQNSLSSTLPPDMGYGLPNLEILYVYGNNFFGNIPNTISNASKLVKVDLGKNEFSGNIPNAFGDLKFLVWLFLEGNNLTTDDSFEFNHFITSVTRCRHLTYLDVSRNILQSKLPNSIGNFSNSLEHFKAYSCGINGKIPPEIGNISNLIRLVLNENDLNGPIPSTIKGLQKLQQLGLRNNKLQGSIIDELCEITSLSELYLSNNKLSGALPTCFGKMTSLRIVDLGSNMISKIFPSFWNLRDVLQVNLSSNALIGNLPPEIGQLRALVLLDLSRNEFSSNIPPTINSLETLQILSFAHNKLQGSIPESIGQMPSLNSLDLSQNLLSGAIPKSLESLPYLQFINFSYNILEGEIPNGGPFKNFTAQSFIHNKALCGNHRLHVPPCDKQVIRRRSKTKLLLIKCILPIIVLTILVVACIILLQRKRRNAENSLEKDPSTLELGVPRWISYYELVQATKGFNESHLLGRGSFGSVYLGLLSSGMTVAIKVINIDLEATSRSFEAECNALRNLRHRNLVKIISSCSNVDFKALIMEFMSNGSLDKWLYSDNYGLNFLQRLNIMIDVAFALEYLHHGSSIPVVHCDLKPSNILLDENKVAHVSDFGIAKLLDDGQSKTHTKTLATLGYIAPEYGSKGIVSVKGDVYSYGIMLLEIFTRKKPTDDIFLGGLTLKNWIGESLTNSIMEVVDSQLVQQDDQIDTTLVHISSILRLALNCCADSPEARFTMEEVTASLIKIKNLFTQK